MHAVHDGRLKLKYHHRWVRPAQSVSMARRLSKLVEVLSGFYGNPTADAERFAVLDRAHELGCTFWDTADGYGDSEELIGEWFRRTDKRNEARGPHLRSQSFDQVSDPEKWAKSQC